MFGRMIEAASGIGKVGGMKVEAARPTGMLVDGEILYPGGQVVNEVVLGVLEEKVFTGMAASNVIALNRMAAPPEPLRRSSTDRSRSIDERLRRLGIGVANR
jgi:hypothetical protein